MQSVGQVMQAAAESGGLSGDSLQPSRIWHKFIDHEHVTEYTTCCINDAHADKLKELLAGGWIMYLMQTELNFGIGHTTVAYFAKMRPN